MKTTFAIPPLHEIKTVEAATAKTPQEAVARLRDLVDKFKGWAARAEARRTEIAELTPESPRDALDISDEDVAEITRLQVQLSMAEVALKTIKADERELIILAAPLLESLRTELDASTTRRVAAVEKAARALLAPIFPTEKLNAAINLLPTVHVERSIASNLSNTGTGVSWKSTGGPNPGVVPSAQTTAQAFVNGLDVLERAVAEARENERKPISFELSR